MITPNCSPFQQNAVMSLKISANEFELHYPAVHSAHSNIWHGKLDENL